MTRTHDPESIRSMMHENLVNYEWIFYHLCTVTIYCTLALSSMLNWSLKDPEFFAEMWTFRLGRSGTQRHHRKILCVADFASCGEGGEGWPCTSTRERRQGYSNPSLRPGDVVTGPLQYLPIAISGDVYLRDIRHVFLYARQGQERTGRRVQL